MRPSSHQPPTEIDIRRQTLLEAGEIDPTTIEQEYLDAKARYQTQIVAGLAWDERTGLATLRNDVNRRVAATQRYEKCLAHTKPATPAGAAALIQYVLDDDLEADENYWHMTALRSAVAPLMAWARRCRHKGVTRSPRLCRVCRRVFLWMA